MVDQGCYDQCNDLVQDSIVLFIIREIEDRPLRPLVDVPRSFLLTTISFAIFHFIIPLDVALACGAPPVTK